MELAAQFLRALLLTAAIEAVVMLLLFRNWQYAYYTLLCNAISNPCMNLLLLLGLAVLGAAAYWPLLVFFECCVVALEGGLLCRLTGLRAKRAFALSALLNVCSAAIGILVL